MSILFLLFAAVITNVADLRHAVWSDLHAGDEFSITCTVTAEIRLSKSFTVMDDTGHCYLRTTNQISPKVGQCVKITGHIGIDQFNWQRAFLEHAELIGEGVLPPPIPIIPEQLNDESFDSRTVIMRGLVTDIVPDEIDPSWRFLIMRSESGSFLVALGVDASLPLDHLIGATVSATGIANVLPDGGKRKFKTPQLTVPGLTGIAIDTPAPEDPFESPRIPYNAQGIENLQYNSAALLSRMGYRSAEGIVVAVFNSGRKILMRTEYGQLVGVDLKSDDAPSYDDRVAVAGFPETDLFILKLANARYRRLDGTSPTVKQKCDPSEPKLLPESFDMDKVLRDMMGCEVRASGKVIGPESSRTSGTLDLACGPHVIPVDISALDKNTSLGIAPGSIVEVTGICTLNTANWNPGDLFPSINGFTIVPRTPHDIRIISRPSWWTTGRLLVVIAVLLTGLLAVLVWNRILRKLIERHGRKLYRMEIEKVESNLRVDERTRLAVELHDSLAQTLTGVSFQIDAAEKMLHDNREAAAGFLDVAKRTLLSCREELRRCLWDLRSQALEEPNMAQAVAKTVRPHTEGVAVAVRFDVRRAQLSDTTAHNVLSIIRELCVNATRHGRAQHIRIDGEMSGSSLQFSVGDDGTGFDPEVRPGPTQGHFGLQGIKERVNRLHGTLKIKSEQGKGTKVTVELGA